MLLAGALSYFAVFSIIPILILIIALLGQILGEQQARAEILNQIQQQFDERMANTIRGFLISAKRSGIGIATLFSGATLFLISSLIFDQIRNALNFVWEVDKAKGVIKGVLLNRLLSFVMLILLGVFFLSTYLLAGPLQALSSTLAEVFPVVRALFVWKVVFNITSIGLFALLFGVVFRYFPQTTVRWKDVWLGALLTSLLFFLVRYILTLPLRFGHFYSLFGAAKSIMLLLLWIYFSAQVFLFGAEFTCVYAKKFGSRRGQPSPSDI